MRVQLLLISLLFSFASNADDEVLLNFEKTMGIYEITALIEVSEIRTGKVYEYRADVIRTYKGILEPSICITHPTTIPLKVGVQVLVSFDSSENCYFLDVGNYINSTQELLDMAEGYVQ